nr:DUF3810 family protein [uncultured Peptostreptococcus sp.]
MFKFKISPILLFIFTSFILGISIKYKKITGLIYTNIINKLIREKLAFLFDKLDIPIGDILSLIIVLALLIVIVNFIKKLFSPSKWLAYICRLFWGSINIFCISFFLFILFYGLNYHTQSLRSLIIDKYNSKYATNINLEVDVSKQIETLKYLENKAIDTKKLVKYKRNTDLSNIKDLSSQAEEGFRIIADVFPSLSGKYSKAKLSIYSPVFDALGIDARYYIFTNEVSINKGLPDIYKPFLVSKYMAHQRGIAREDEAFFFAYLAGINNTDPNIKYSAYISALSMMTQSMMFDNKVEYNYYVSNMDRNIRVDMEKVSEYRARTTYGKSIINQVKYTFKRLNGDLRQDSLEKEVSSLITSYYSLFAY